VEGVDEAVGGIAGDDVDLFVDEGAIDQAEVHDAGRGGEMQAVELAPAAETVGPLEEFVAEAGAHFGGKGSDVAGVAKMEALGVFGAHDHGKGVLEAERLGDFEIEALSVALFHASIDVVRVGARRFVEDGCQGGAGVFDVEIEIAGEERFLAEKGAAEIGFAVDAEAGAGFDVLGQEFCQDYLLGEKFGADGQVGLAFSAAERNQQREREEEDKTETQSTLRGRKEGRHKERKEFNTEFTEGGARVTEKRKDESG
jgi:hypothetical protein